MAKRAEELGFESIWVPEQHTLPVQVKNPIPKQWGEIVDPLIALARASAVTTNIKLGTAVLVVPARNPITLAKEIGTLDTYCGGRFLFGVGVGSVPEEAQVLGVDFNHRWTQAKDTLHAMKELWTKEESSYQGKYHSFPALYCFPKPVANPHPPIILGGNAPNVFKRIATWADGWIPIDITVEQVKFGRAKLDRFSRLMGRDPKSISISVVAVPPEPELIKSYFEAGADRVIVLIETESKNDEINQLERIAQKIF